MFQSIFLLALLPFTLFVSTESLTDMRDRLKDRVIHIETLHERGRWLWQNDNQDADGSRYLFIDPLPERDTYYTPRVQFKTKLCAGKKYLCLEPFSLPNYYLTAGFPAGGTKYTVKLQHSVYVEDDDRFHWKVHCEDDSLERCLVIPVRFESDGFIMVADDWGGGGAHEGHFDATLGKDKNIGWFRVHAPNPTDGFNEIYRNTNAGTTQQTAKYETLIGISQTHQTTHTITSSTTAEIGGAFKAFSASVSTTIESSWETADSKTYEASTKVTHSLTLPARTTIVLYQLRGEYDGNFKVADDSYQIQEILLDTVPSKVRYTRYVYHKPSAEKEKDEL